MIRNAIKDISGTHSRTNVTINVVTNVVTNEEKIIALLRQDGNMSANMLSAFVGITGKLYSKFKASGDFSGSLLCGKLL